MSYAITILITYWTVFGACKLIGFDASPSAIVTGACLGLVFYDLSHIFSLKR